MVYRLRHMWRGRPNFLIFAYLNLMVTGGDAGNEQLDELMCNDHNTANIKKYRIITSLMLVCMHMITYCLMRMIVLLGW
jgi:hypothetical protein